MQRAASFLPKRVGAWQDTRYACRLRFTGNVSQNNVVSARCAKLWVSTALALNLRSLGKRPL